MRLRAFFLIITITAWALDVRAQPAGTALLEYRLEALPDQLSETFQWWDASVSRQLETEPFLITADFAAARVTTRWCNKQPGCYNILLIHTAAGTRKFNQIAGLSTL